MAMQPDRLFPLPQPTPSTPVAQSFFPKSWPRMLEAVVSSRSGSTFFSTLSSPSGAFTYLTETELTQCRSYRSKGNDRGDPFGGGSLEHPRQ